MLTLTDHYAPRKASAEAFKKECLAIKEFLKRKFLKKTHIVVGIGDIRPAPVAGNHLQSDINLLEAPIVIIDAATMRCIVVRIKSDTSLILSEYFLDPKDHQQTNPVHILHSRFLEHTPVNHQEQLSFNRLQKHPLSLIARTTILTATSQ